MALADIDTIVVVMLENRSFDHMLGYLSMGASPLPVDGLREDPEWLARYINVYRGSDYPLHVLPAEIQSMDDPPHEHATIDMQINRPTAAAMGGFVESYMRRTSPPATPSVVMGYYTAEAVPMFDFFARNFTVCDRWFAALPLGTQANRLMAMSGESRIVDNASTFLPDQPLVYEWLKDHGVNWCVYQSGHFLPFFSLMPRLLTPIMSSLSLSDFGARSRFRRYARFREEWLNDAATPAVIFIEPEYTDGPHHYPNDDHPPTGVLAGQSFLSDIYATLTSNPSKWQKTLMIVTYDEHGGFFDHVPPLPIPANVGEVQISTTGVRVPAFIVSPRVAPGVFSGNLDHTSILQLLADRFDANQDYSAAVGARQPQLDRLAALINSRPAPAIGSPPIGPVVTPDAHPDEETAPPAAAPAEGAAANAQALANAAVKAARDHPELVNQPAWQPLLRFAAQFR